MATSTPLHDIRNKLRALRAKTRKDIDTTQAEYYADPAKIWLAIKVLLLECKEKEIVAIEEQLEAAFAPLFSNHQSDPPHHEQT